MVGRGGIIIEEINIYNISYKKFNELIEEWSNCGDVSYSLFLTKKNNKYLALDNEGADCYVEEFNTLDKALYWLVNKDLMAEDVMNLQDIEVRQNLRRFNYKIIKNNSLNFCLS